MARSDYAHWNEDADRMWWEEEGKHADQGEPLYDLDDYLPHWEGDYEGPEHLDRSDCHIDGNFSLPTATGIWECDNCGRQLPEFTVGGQV